MIIIALYDTIYYEASTLNIAGSNAFQISQTWLFIEVSGFLLVYADSITKIVDAT